MNTLFKLSLITCIVLSFTLSFVSANDNVTDCEILKDNVTNNTPSISISNSKVNTGESIDIYLKDSDNSSLSNQNLTANIDNKDYSLLTDFQGKTSLKLNLKANNYVLKVFFRGNGNFSDVNQTFNIQVLKLKSDLVQVTSKVINGNYFYTYLKNQKGESITGVKVTFSVNGKSYTDTTNSQGRSGFKVNLNPSYYSIKITFAGNDYYESISKTFNLLVPHTTSLVIGNTRLLTNGYLRIYLKSPTQSVVSKKTVKININGKTFTKKTNSEGIIIFKPKMGKGSLSITVSYGGTSDIVGSSASKVVNGIKGNVKNPLKQKIPLLNGVPDIDLMPGNYVMADEDFTYTVKKAQYRDVLKRDSYSLYLNKKLSKYTFFKSKAEPKLNHIIKREKWNVIERAVNTKLVKKNKKGYWPKSVTVSLKGKSYTYSEVRDKQNTPYTCAPTSGSMCSQVLRNYVCEKQLAKQAGTISGFGTKCQWIKKALEKNHFKCSYFTKKSFNKALKQLKKGGCALIFHAENHYLSILDISKDGKKILLANSYGSYDEPGKTFPNRWVTVKYMKSKFCSYDQCSLVVKLKYNLNTATKKKINNLYSNMGSKWTRMNTNEKILNVG